MSIDKQALRVAAERATGSHDRLSVMPADDIFDISQYEGTQLDADIAALNVFNEAANPATVLALLDELESDKEVVELQRFKLERQAEDLHQAKSLESIHREKRFEVEREFDSYKHRAQENSGRLAGEVIRLEDELEAAEKRIAELEARTLTVKLPEGKDSPQGWKVDPEFIRKVQDAIGYDEECQCWEGTPSMEIVEAVLIAAAGIHLKVEE